MRKRNLIIIGAGEAGLMIANEYIKNEKLFNKYNLIGYLDDYKTGGILNFQIIGTIDKAKNVIEEHKIDDVIIAIPSAHNNLISKIINSINGCDVRIKIVPGLSEIIEGDVKIKQIRDFEPSDFLGREEVSFDVKKISGYYNDKTVLVTGGAGSIGSEVVKELLELPVRKVVIYGHGENSIHDLIHKINGNRKFDYIIGDVTDYNKLKFSLDKFKPDIIFHAAAHKHVPLMEKCPDEALRNNIIGTYNVALLAGEEKVKKFILVSTDKAVNPTSIMGASKRICEKMIISLSQLYPDTNYSLTRFGNVLGSRGSVVPTFKTQIEKGGPVTITDPNMTRFFMSIREAARLVIKSGTINTGKIFILDMGKPVKILDLAKNMIRLYGSNLQDIKIEYTGARDGEKLYEEILTEKESVLKTKFDKLFISDEKETIMNSAELNNMIQDIKKAILSYDNEKIKKVIKKYVPEYQGLINAH